jgi:predicted transposase/invertase (TIGR01784 family)
MIEVAPLKFGAVFKLAFGQVEVFKQFVKDVLDIELNIDKVHTEYEYPNPVGFVRSKYDLFAEDVDKRIIVEIQHVKEEDFFDRFLYYHLVSLVEQIGNYQDYNFERTVYTIVVLTTVPRDGSIQFSCAISDMNPIDEFGNKHEIYPHRLIFLNPRLVNEHTPAKIKKWLELIEDSLDGWLEESRYSADSNFQAVLNKIYRHSIDRDLLAQIKDETAWEKAKQLERQEGFEEGVQHGIEQGIQYGIEQGVQQGLEQGMQQGMQQGEKQARLETARKMLADGMPIEMVLKYTELTHIDLEES